MINKGCGKRFCMDCGVMKGTGYHEELCTMGDTGWINCGEEYDGDLMLCSECRIKEAEDKK